MSSILSQVFAVLTVGIALSGCSVQVPADPNGTLDRIQGSTLRVGASVEEHLVERDENGASGSVATLVEAFAERHGAAIEWSWGSEETLVNKLERQEIDIAIGGFTDQTPWSDRAAITRGYSNLAHARSRSIVLLAPLGENRLVTTLETFLDQELVK